MGGGRREGKFKRIKLKYIYTDFVYAYCFYICICVSHLCWADNTSRQRSEGISSLELESLQVAMSTLEMEQEQVLLTTHPSFQPSSCLPLFFVCLFLFCFLLALLIRLCESSRYSPQFCKFYLWCISPSCGIL